MSHSDIILVGAGGHAKSVVEVVENASKSLIIKGYLDFSRKNDTFWSEINFLGIDNEHLVQSEIGYHISLGMIKNLKIRQTLFDSFKIRGAFFPIIISKHAIISKYSKLGEGSIFMHNVLVNAGVLIGQNCILNSKCLVEHDAVVGNHCHISTGAILNADCRIGNNVYIGSNSSVNRGIEIGDNVIVASGSVVTKNISSNSIAMGVPAKVI